MSQRARAQAHPTLLVVPPASHVITLRQSHVTILPARHCLAAAHLGAQHDSTQATHLLLLH
jgi:hypothetical protein